MYLPWQPRGDMRRQQKENQAQKNRFRHSLGRPQIQDTPTQVNLSLYLDCARECYVQSVLEYFDSREDIPPEMCNVATTSPRADVFTVFSVVLSPIVSSYLYYLKDQ